MDILLDSNYEPIIENGDFKTGDSIMQRQSLLLVTGPGDWKEYPFAGVGISDYLNNESPSGMVSEVKRKFKADGLKVINISYTNNELRIDAERS